MWESTQLSLLFKVRLDANGFRNIVFVQMKMAFVLPVDI